MNIHQLSVRYLQEQDRILIRINTTTDEEVRMWITRRFLLGFYPLLSNAVTEHTVSLEGASTAAAGEEAKKMLAEFKQAEVMGSTDTKTPFRSTAQSFPFGATPLLVTVAQVGWEPQGNLQLNFEERLHPERKPRSFRLGLGQQLAHGLVHLLERESTKAGWYQAEAGVAGPGEAASETAANAPPRYLN